MSVEPTSLAHGRAAGCKLPAAAVPALDGEIVAGAPGAIAVV